MEYITKKAITINNIRQGQKWKREPTSLFVLPNALKKNGES
jgi:hypothetical protein